MVEMTPGFADELRYWTGAVSNPETEEGDIRSRSEAVIQVGVLSLLRQTGPGPYKVIDVGAGPVSVLGHHTEVFLTAVDPLADEYNALLDKAGIVPTVRTSVGKAGT